MPLPESACRWCDTLDQLLIEVSAQPAAIAAPGVVREVLQSLKSLRPRDAVMAANISISGRERHAEAIVYCFFGGCRELRRHMAGCLVCSGC